jgi:transaldolase
MSMTDSQSELSRRTEELVRTDAAVPEGKSSREFPSHPLWARLRELGTELWLDSGDIDAISDIWTREFSGLTTNNSLLNREIQKGTYDALIERATKMLDEYPLLSEEERKLELAFILNTHHALKLIERFGAMVSVEEHTLLTADLEGAINYARRFHALNPEGFYVKIPFSAAGLLATRRVAGEGVPVNHTLGFSARQNYLITRIGRPRFVNVFLGRLNSFVADNDLGSGRNVGERATLASQAAVRKLRDEHDVPTRQIAASLRSGEQVAALAGVDVITMPPKVAREFLDSGIEPGDLQDRTATTPEIDVDAAKTDPANLDSLWEINDELVAAVDALEEERMDMFTPTRLRGFFQRSNCGDVLPKWTEDQVAASAAEGKIPSLDNWREELAEGRIGLDSLMNLAGWNSFDGDQREMDRHVEEVMAAARK